MKYPNKSIHRGINNLRFFAILGLAAHLVFASSAFAVTPSAPPSPVLSNVGNDVIARDTQPNNEIIYSAQTGTHVISSNPQSLVIKLIATCFGANVRTIPSPLSPTSSVQFAISILGHPIGVYFPGRFTTTNPSPAIIAGEVNVVTATAVNVASLDVERQTIRVITQNINMQSILGAGGNYSASTRANAIDFLNFRQDVQNGALGIGWNDPVEKKGGSPLLASLFSVFERIGVHFSGLLQLSRAFAGGGDGNFSNGDWTSGAHKDASDLGFLETVPPLTVGADPANRPFIGKDGELTSSFTTAWSGDMSVLEVHAAFPGVVGFCGGFRSPLMLFFDSARSRFQGWADFQIHPYSTGTNWVSPGDPGYFLALDRNHDGVINDASELFGQDGDSGNGFEALRAYDSNRDGVIDERDPIFSQLLLWQDKNGDGISQPDELYTLKSMGVSSISLKYEAGRDIALGDRASYRENAKFTFRKNGVKTTGQIIDVWLTDRR